MLGGQSHISENFRGFKAVVSLLEQIQLAGSSGSSSSDEPNRRLIWLELAGLHFGAR